MVGGEELSVVITNTNAESITLGNQAPIFLEAIDGVGNIPVELENQSAKSRWTDLY